MFAIRTVLCAVDFSPATPRQVDIAADLCRAFEARLVLHHNIPSAGVGAAVGWMWAASHPPDTPQAVDERLRLELARAARGLTAEARVTEGPIAQTVLMVAEAVQADVVVLSTHGTTTDDHTSITEDVLHSGRRAVLALHDETLDRRAPRFAATTGDPQIVVVPTDLTAESRGAIECGVELARRLPIELHLLHLRSGGPASASRPADDALRREMAVLVPPEFESRVRLHLEDGDAARGIVQAATDLSASCVIMGEHTRAPLRRWFTRDTSHAVLHQAPCPVWYVPGPLSREA